MALTASNNKPQTLNKQVNPYTQASPNQAAYDTGFYQDLNEAVVELSELALSNTQRIAALEVK
jgi:hypothetical protein